MFQKYLELAEDDHTKAEQDEMFKENEDGLIQTAKAALQAMIDHDKGLSFLTVVEASSMPVGNAEQMINSFLKAAIEDKA